MPGHDAEPAGREVRVLLRLPPLLLELLQRLDDLDRLLERVDPDRVARAAGPDGERTVAAVRGLPLDVNLQPAGAGRDRRDRQRPRRVRRLRHDCGVGTEPGPDAGERAELVLGGLLPDHRMELEIAREPRPGVLERLRGEPHRHGRGLHVGRAEPIEAPVADLRRPRAPAQPAIGLGGWDGVDVAVQEQRATSSTSRSDADEVPPLGILRHPVRLETGLRVALGEDLVDPRLAADVLLARDPGIVRVHRSGADQLVQQLDRLVSARVDRRPDPFQRLRHGHTIPEPRPRVPSRRARPRRGRRTRPCSGRFSDRRDRRRPPGSPPPRRTSRRSQRRS